MPSFELVVVGSGGGPLETNLSAYLLRDFRSDWSQGIVGIEAGSGIGALTHLLSKDPGLFGELSKGFSKPSSAAAHVMRHVHTYLITHAHLDHIAALVLSAGSFLEAERKKIISSKVVLEYIETAFQDRLWPNLASYNPKDPPYNYLLSVIDTDDNGYHKISPTISIRCMPLSHGKTTKQEDYPSLAYFVRHKITTHQFLFFGDVEPDSISGKGTSREVWRAAAPLIAEGLLNTIFLECSWLSGRPDPQLFGHLSPPYFVEEIRVLAKEVIACRQAGIKNKNEMVQETRPVSKRRRGHTVATSDRPLAGVKVYVIHCKEPMEETKDPRTIAQITAAEIRSLCKDDLGVEIIAAEPGMRLLI